MESEHHIHYPIGHTLLVFSDDDDLLVHLLPAIETNLSRDGICLFFLRDELVGRVSGEIDKNFGGMLTPDQMQFYPNRDFSDDLFLGLVAQYDAAHSREILVVREIPPAMSHGELIREERRIESFLKEIPAVIICLARESSLSPRCKLHSLAVHPWVAMQGMLMENFYYTHGGTGQSDHSLIWRHRLDTLQLQGLLRQEMVGKEEASSKEMQTRIQELSILHSVASSAARTFDLRSLVQETLPVLSEFLEMDAAAIHCPGEKGEMANLTWARSAIGQELLKVFDVSGELMRKCIERGRPLWSNEMDCLQLGIDLPRPFNNFSYIITPMVLRNGTTGVLKFLSLSTVELSAEKVELARAAAYQIGIGVENSRLYNEVLGAKREWEATFNSISDMILIRDHTFRTLRYNQNLGARFKLRKDEGSGQECYRLLFKRDTPCPQCMPIKDNQEWEVQEPQSSQDSRIVRHRVFSLRDKGGKIIGAIHIALDITEEERLRQQLYHADKMSALGQMISGIAHEVNNPLTGILGFTEILLDQFLPPPQKELLEKVNIEANRATHVMRGLLSLARDHKPKREATDLCKLVTECLNIRAHDFQMKNIRVVRHFQDVPLTTADPNKLRQVFMNIITNAEHAIMDHAGHGTIMVDVYRNNGLLEVNISDDGPGIPPEKAKKVFEPFYTTKEPGRGTGLGLAISHAIIAEHEGSIEVQRSSLGGTSFIIRLPLVNPPRREETEKPDTKGDVQKANVLVVDDEPSLRKIISVALGKQGHNVRTASCAYDALRLYKEEVPDLLILDMKMPGMGGIELCEHLPEPLPPIIAMSGDTVSEEIQAFAAQNGAEFLPKPFTIQEILQAVGRCLSKINRVSGVGYGNGSA